MQDKKQSYSHKLKLIIVGWKNLAFKTQKVEDMAFDRAAICAECPFNIDSTCDLCGCPLKTKTRSPESKCPEGKW